MQGVDSRDSIAPLTLLPRIGQDAERFSVEVAQAFEDATARFDDAGLEGLPRGCLYVGYVAA
ncbi:MAG: hypothetical protein RMK51_11180 [Meiothermus sp.]|uniref:hypothetical protein n=1 Tax=Meiothermus sp. TaxID=1955249 RepID=UPI00298F20BF|nr:hypothetical protein [Meiothermus sp.]MDW8426488.1 hypothetical protein [Meiothermus sp.]